MKERTRNTLLALFVMLLWGSLFPAIKLSYRYLSIDTARVGNILLFAGVRFLIGGGVITEYCLALREKLRPPDRRSAVGVGLVGLFAVACHYTCTYIGLSMTDSAKTALLKQSGVILFVCFSFLFFKDEKCSAVKILSALLGLCAIAVLNIDSLGVSLGIGELLIILASVCTVASNVVCKKMTSSMPPLCVTGLSQLFGGILLTAIGLLTGGRFGTLTLQGVLLFLYICVASIVSYSLWYLLVMRTSLSGLFIIKFTEPLFAAVIGALLLRENVLKWQYLAAFLLVFVSILFGNLKTPPKKTDSNG